MTDRHDHWEKVYATKAATDVSWYQAHARRSLELIHAAAPDRSAPIIDIGGGASTLVDDLLADGYLYTNASTPAGIVVVRPASGSLDGGDLVTARHQRFGDPRELAREVLMDEENAPAHRRPAKDIMTFWPEPARLVEGDSEAPVDNDLAFPDPETCHGCSGRQECGFD